MPYITLCDLVFTSISPTTARRVAWLRDAALILSIEDSVAHIVVSRKDLRGSGKDGTPLGNRTGMSYTPSACEMHSFESVDALNIIGGAVEKRGERE